MTVCLNQLKIIGLFDASIMCIHIITQSNQMPFLFFKDVRCMYSGLIVNLLNDQLSQILNSYSNLH